MKGMEPIQVHPVGSRVTFQNKKQRDPIRAQGAPPSRGETPILRKKDFKIIKSLEFFYELRKIEDNLLKLFNKLNASKCMNGIVN